MPVQVVRPSDNGTDSRIDTHEQATRVEIDDAHLFVMDNARVTIAVYAPTKWLNATVTKSAEG